MNGVTILAEREMNVYGFNQVWFWSIVCAFFVVGIIIGIAQSIYNDETITGGICVTLISTMLITILGTVVGLFVSIFVIPVGTETIYDVIIEENVSFSEFIKHYEIIKQNGLIYTVREIK